MMIRFLTKSSLLTILTSFVCLYILSYCMRLDVRRFPGIRSRNNTTKTILFWNTMFGNRQFYFGNGDVFHGCPVNDCIATHDRSYMDIADFDAILFHGNEIDLDDVPIKRKQKQRFVYANLESPENRPLPQYTYDYYFNLTMTYRLDSDIVWPYAFVRDIKTNNIVAPVNNPTWDTSYLADQELETPIDELSALIAGKNIPVSWIVSNCNAKSGRQAFVKELSKYIQVDIYGHCGSFSCSRSHDCLQELVEPEYFFYLSFENSLCLDYVTEKLYKPLRYHVIPVVYGGANYSRFAPPHSYINALDFDTPKDLALYLKMLMQNPSEYRKYFAWKNRYRIEIDNKSVRCALCKLLHEKNETKVYDRLRDYYSLNACPFQSLLYKNDYVTKTLLKDLIS